VLCAHSFRRCHLSGTAAIKEHVLRDLVFGLQGHGEGVQAEAFLSYLVTHAFSVAVGARYWSLWTTSATDAVSGVVEPRNNTFRTERLGVMLQASSKFDLAHVPLYTKAPIAVPLVGLDSM
jgi:hypothetical protein